MTSLDATSQLLIRTLREAVNNGELESIRQVDGEIRAHAEEIAHQHEVSIVRRELEQLLGEYVEFIAGVEKIQKLVGDQLRDVQRGSQALDKYQLFMKPTAA